MNCNQFSLVCEVVTSTSKREWRHSGTDLGRLDRLTVDSIWSLAIIHNQPDRPDRIVGEPRHRDHLDRLKMFLHDHPCWNE